MSAATASFLRSLSPEKWKSLQSIWVHVFYCLTYMKSRTHLHSTVMTTAHGRTEKGADICYLEAEETHTEDLKLEMLTCDADQLQKGLWDLGYAGPVNTKDSKMLATYHSWHQHRAIFLVKGSLLQIKFGVEISSKKKGECIHCTFVTWDY